MSRPQTTTLSRRDFLRRVGAGAATVAGIQILASEPVAGLGLSSEVVQGPTWGVLIDVTRCQGCNSCALACKAVNGLPNRDSVPTSLESDAYTFVDERQVTTADGRTETRHVKRQCMHCLDAACVSACPAAAMHNSGQGPVIYRADRCLGCRYCQLACPFEMPRFQWDNGIDPVISKCWMCYSRLEEGELPACVDACPTGALRFGRRSDLLVQAHAQIRSNPGRYVDYVYGEREVGGTSMLYLSDVPFEQLGLPAHLPFTAPPEETEKIMTKLPAVIGGVTALMTGAALVSHRRPAKMAHAIMHHQAEAIDSPGDAQEREL